MTDKPFVSVVTPVYNGGKYLAECIESVIGQTYADIEYVILDNASTDETPAIIDRFARTDGRIRVVRNDATLPIIQNWNKALMLISPRSAYCKISHADDMMYPDCIQRMVELAERNPSVGVIGSLRLRGDRVQCEGLPRGREVFSGTEIVRLFLRHEVFALAPTSGMVRSDLVRAQQPFYPVKYLHADHAAYFELLDRIDFGFIHDVLSFSRTHADSVTTTVAERQQTILREWLFLLREYGPRYLPADELAALERAHLKHYYRVLLRRLVTRPSWSFMRYHMSGLREAGRLPGPRDLAAAIATEIRASLTHPEKLYSHLRGPSPRR